MKGQSIINPTAPRRPHRNNSNHGRLQSGAIRAETIKRLKLAGVKIPVNATTVRLVQLVSEHTGEPAEGRDWEYLVRFTCSPVDGATPGRLVDLMNAPPLRTSMAMRLALERAKAVYELGQRPA
jgi:hypothetical protein